MDEFRVRLAKVLESHPDIQQEPGRRQLIAFAVEHREALVAKCGCLATWTPSDSTGRSPQDTVTVLRPESEGNIDWSSPNNLPITPETFDMIFADAVERLAKKSRLYLLKRVVGADVRYALPLQVITDRALQALFCDNMFCPVPEDINRSSLAEKPFILIALPYDRLDPNRYTGRLRRLPTTNQTSTMVIAIDFDHRLGIIIGSAYCGSIKKMMFTVMNYLLPEKGILPLHCSANEGQEGDIALFLGLSGTGKTSLSTDPERKLLGDDEHGWSDDGIANFENGCYAKLINLDPKKEPEIYQACFHEAPYLEHGAIVENAMIYPDGTFDLSDSRLTENSRGSYPLSFLSNIKTPPIGGHPKAIIFLTADANGVLPPVAKLTNEQAMFWFLVGYTSKLAGTETGIIEPKSTFSRFFGQPFMPRNPDAYARLLGEKLRRHNTKVYLVNTGWTGGPYGVGKRIDITLTRQIIRAILKGALENVDYESEPFFRLQIPRSCPGVPDPVVLNPKNTWQDRSAYEERAKKLANEFNIFFHHAYRNKGIDPIVARECPGSQ
ncbi:MAG: phosphoenolpyruvate carboxykinase (ATP) [candidate division WOR-3 bacterium]